ncbi:MAG: rRNA maturation RNase YbeY [Clostridia bacterium]|nr:rRNA maturation RNase YbeY [Clostridia bacterium]
MQKIKVNFEIADGIKIPLGTKRLIKRSCAAVLKSEDFLENAEVNVSIVSADEIKELNGKYRDIDKVTDVLSFPLGSNGVYDLNPENNCFMLGDVVICFERAVQQASDFGHSVTREISFLTVHSMLHLLGYDHVDSQDEEKEMFSKQKQIMSALGIER